MRRELGIAHAGSEHGLEQCLDRLFEQRIAAASRFADLIENALEFLHFRILSSGQHVTIPDDAVDRIGCRGDVGHDGMQRRTECPGV